MKADIVTTNFTSGEISPMMMGRNDLLKYQNGAKEVLVEAQVKTEIETLQVHKETADAGALTTSDREFAIDTLVSLLLKYAPVLEQLRMSQPDLGKAALAAQAEAAANP